VRGAAPYDPGGAGFHALAETLPMPGALVVPAKAGMDEKEDVVAFLLVAVIETVGVSLVSYLHGRHLHALVRTEKGAEVMTSMSSLLSSVRRR